MWIRLGALALVFVGVAFAPSVSADLDCRDFDSPDDAQDYFDQNPGDPDRLDADNDGRACEPYSGGTSPWLWAAGGAVATGAVIAVTRAR